MAIASWGRQSIMTLSMVLMYTTAMMTTTVVHANYWSPSANFAITRTIPASAVRPMPRGRPRSYSQSSSDTTTSSPSTSSWSRPSRSLAEEPAALNAPPAQRRADNSQEDLDTVRREESATADGSATTANKRGRRNRINALVSAEKRLTSNTRLSGLVRAFEPVLMGGGMLLELDTHHLLRACHSFTNLLHNMGQSYLAKDMELNIRKVESALHRVVHGPYDAPMHPHYQQQYHRHNDDDPQATDSKSALLALSGGGSSSKQVKVQQAPKPNKRQQQQQQQIGNTVYSLLEEEKELGWHEQPQDHSIVQHVKSLTDASHSEPSSVSSLTTLSESSAAMNLLWLRRNLSFQHRFYSTVLDDGKKNLSPIDAALSAYHLELEPYHSWPVRKLYETAIRTSTPATKRELYAAMGGFEPNSLEKVQEMAVQRDLRQWLDLTRPILCRWKKTYSDLGLDDTHHQRHHSPMNNKSR